MILTRSMEERMFHQQINQIVSEYRLDQHPYVDLIASGKATPEQLKGYPIQHYEMTVRDSAPLSAEMYLRLRALDEEVGQSAAKGFAEEALGLYSHTASHTELLFELWEGGLGLPRKQLIQSIGSPGRDGLQHLHLSPHAFEAGVYRCDWLDGGDRSRGLQEADGGV